MASNTSTPIRIGIVGYGNLGRGVEAAIRKNPDMKLTGIYTRRDPSRVEALDPATRVLTMESLLDHKGQIDVLVLCGGSKDDLPRQAPELAAHFNVVDSFDTHARIPEHFAKVDAAARAGETTALISAGWDPGMFSINRVMGEALLPDGATYTFWGHGLSQGHSDAIRRVPGVAGGVQYTVPVPEAVEKVRSGLRPELSTREKHTRECFVVLEAGADADAVRQAIVNMPHYFDHLHHRRRAEARPRGDAPRRLRHPQRQHLGRLQASHRVSPAARQQPGVHCRRAGRLCACRAPHAPAGATWLQDGVRRGAWDALAEEPRRAAQRAAVSFCSARRPFEGSAVVRTAMRASISGGPRASAGRASWA